MKVGESVVPVHFQVYYMYEHTYTSESTVVKT